MTGTFIRVLLCLCALSCSKYGIAGDSVPSWLLSRPRLENLLKRSVTKLFPDFYAEPSLLFVVDPDEQIVHIEINSMSANEAQGILDTCFEENSSAVFVVRVTGVIEVLDAPLSPYSKTCFVFDKGARVIAGLGSTAKSLIAILDRDSVSITGSVDPRVHKASAREPMFYGNNTIDVGLQIENSGRVHIDRVSIAACQQDGMRVIGQDASRYDCPVSLTRTTISACGENGADVRQSSAFIVLDSKITSVGRVALSIDSPSSIVANTLCADSDTGIVVHSSDALLVRNQVVRNQVGVCLAKQSEFSLVYENMIRENDVGVVFDGKEATVGWNAFQNRADVRVGGTKNILYSNHGVSAQSVSGSGVAYFNPPTASSLHDEPVIWRDDSGVTKSFGRHDVVIDARREEMDTREVNRRLQKERESNPDTVLVVMMQGAFVNKSEEGLSLPDHTCVILDGKVVNVYQAKDPGSFELLRMKGKGCCSFSGGQLISEQKVFSACSGADAKNAFLLDGVSIDLHAKHGGFGSDSVNAVSSKKHYGSFVVRGCDIRDPGHRGIWMHVSKRVYALGNRCSAGGFSIDFDAYCFHSAAIFNTVTRNSYHSGIFFEECVNSNTAFANFCEKNPANGICMWTENVQGKTEKNVVACNVIRGGVEMEANRSGLSLGGRAADRTTENNYFFNNRLEDLNGRSAILIKKHARGNYISQSSLDGNGVNILNLSVKPETNGFRDQVGFHSPSVQ
jgi:hypothetical protein